MSFLLKSDYGPQIKADLLNTITEGSEKNRADAELAAQSEMESELRGRYDLGQIFIDVLPWAAGQYTQGAAVAHGTPAIIYTAGRDTLPGEEPGAEGMAEAWLPKDPRHPLIKMYLIDCTLYHLHSRQNPQSIPTIRLDRYDRATEWLKMCRTGKISPGLPLLPATAADGTPNLESIRPRGGSAHQKLNNAY
jgi:hypothetical protein